MTRKDLFELFQIEDLKDLPDAVMNLLNGEKDKRDSVYRRLIELNNYDMSYDWFQEVVSLILSI